MSSLNNDYQYLFLCSLPFGSIEITLNSGASVFHIGTVLNIMPGNLISIIQLLTLSTEGYLESPKNLVGFECIDCVEISLNFFYQVINMKQSVLLKLYHIVEFLDHAGVIIKNWYQLPKLYA